MLLVLGRVAGDRLVAELGELDADLGRGDPDVLPVADVASEAFARRAADVVKTCAIRSERSVGVYPLPSFFNHGCAPNAETRFEENVYDGFDDAKKNANAARRPETASAPRARVVALRDVAAGEELTHAYVDVTRPAEVRAAALAGFGFKCGCERCARARGG